jgi:hypothetical protein
MNRTLKKLLLTGVLALGGCEPAPATVDTELQLNELQTQVQDLDTQLNNAYAEVSRLSALLSQNMAILELAVSEVDRKVLDLRGGNAELTVPEVEAAVAVTKMRLLETKATAAELAAYVAPDPTAEVTTP